MFIFFNFFERGSVMRKELIDAMFRYSLIKVNVGFGIEVANLMSEFDKKNSLIELYNKAIETKFSKEIVDLGKSLGVEFTPRLLSYHFDKYLRKGNFLSIIEVAKRLKDEERIGAIQKILDKVVSVFSENYDSDEKYTNWLTGQFIDFLNLLPESDRTVRLEKDLIELIKYLPIRFMGKIDEPLKILKRKLTSDEIVSCLDNHLSRKGLIDHYAITLAGRLRLPKKRSYLKKILSNAVDRGQYYITKEIEESSGISLDEIELKRLFYSRLNKKWIDEETFAITSLLSPDDRSKALFKILDLSLRKEDIDNALISAQKLYDTNKVLALEKIIIWCLKGDRWLSKAKIAVGGLPDSEHCKKVLLEMLK